MELYRGYKFRIYPTKEQKNTIAQIINNCNFIYNHFINEQRQSYQNTGKFLSVSKCIKTLPSLKKEFPQLKQGESTSLQQTVRHLDRAYTNFFNNYSNYPHYKSGVVGNSYTCTKNGSTPSNIRIDGDKLVLPKLGRVRVNWHHDLPDNVDITSATVRMNYSGKYEVSLQVRKEVDIEKADDVSAVGIVYHPDHLFIASDSSHGEIPESYKKIQKRIKRLKQSLKRKKRGSSNWKKESLKLSKAIEKAQNIKRDYLHKWSKELTENYNTIVVKDINPELFNMKHSRKEGWNQFLTFLEYKVKERGGEFILE